MPFKNRKSENVSRRFAQKHQSEQKDKNEDF